MKAIINFFKNIIDKWRQRSLKKVEEQIKEVLLKLTEDSKLMDNFLELLLEMMRLMFCLNIAHYKKQIRGFNGTFVFISKDGKIASSAIFANNKMKVKKKAVPDYDIKIIFKDGRALGELMLSGSLDVLTFMLDGRISPEGNLNYLFKLSYMVMHLQTAFKLKLPKK
ncbi:MAG: hypothetical protein KAW12_31130 [Candidatus Aminicenantes bacterium]|nr:hypothetical protein [Candidatus Aminicenantes bacterium]